MSIRFTEISESDAITTYRLTKIVTHMTTSAGFHTMIGDSAAYGRMLFLDGELQSAEADEHIYHESLVHPVMASVAEPKRVLVVGGGEGATVREVLRWQPEHVDWVDYDADLVTACRLHLRWAPAVYDDPRVHYQAADIRDALPALGTYDVIILDLPDPDGDTGYLYSPEFWRDMRAHLRESGALVTHCGPVHPYGGVGDGFRRVWATTATAGLQLTPAGFYHIGMPSFQGDWGFWMWRVDGRDPFHFVQEDSAAAMPADLRVADMKQIRAWATKMRVWNSAITACDGGCV